MGGGDLVEICTVLPTAWDVVLLREVYSLTRMCSFTTQFYQLLGTWWTFLNIRNVNQCKEHAELCPLPPNKSVNLTTVHPPLNPLTPYGWSVRVHTPPPPPNTPHTHTSIYLSIHLCMYACMHVSIHTHTQHTHTHD